MNNEYGGFNLLPPYITVIVKIAYVERARGERREKYVHYNIRPEANASF
jgi:hypothetical protein